MQTTELTEKDALKVTWLGLLEDSFSTLHLQWLLWVPGVLLLYGALVVLATWHVHGEEWVFALQVKESLMLEKQFGELHNSVLSVLYS